MKVDRGMVGHYGRLRHRGVRTPQLSIIFVDLIIPRGASPRGVSKARVLPSIKRVLAGGVPEGALQEEKGSSASQGLAGTGFDFHARRKFDFRPL
jgi:hypothetical protein